MDGGSHLSLVYLIIFNIHKNELFRTEKPSFLTKPLFFDQPLSPFEEKVQQRAKALRKISVDSNGSSFDDRHKFQVPIQYSFRK